MELGGFKINMNPKLSTPNHFLNREINLPSRASSAAIFNKIFQDGLSFNTFESFIKTKAISEAQLSHAQFRNVSQYNLQKDIWGVKEAVMISKGGTAGTDVAITYVIRDANEWTHLVNFFESKPNAVEIENKPGHRLYEYRNAAHTDGRQITFHILRDTPQSSRVSLFLTF